MMAHPIPEDFWRALRTRGLIPEEAPTPQAPARHAIASVTDA
jgi:hypothetical protein